MSKISPHPSLLSYLDRKHAPPLLRLHLLPHPTQQTLFCTVPDNDPLAQVYKAAFITDCGAIIKEVQLLIQRDTPLLPQGNETNISNALIDDYWQQMARIRRTRNPEHSMFLGAQLGEDETLLAFAPLVYCRQRQEFMELSCPHCGQALSLCKDDSLLDLAGLAPYSTSLRRYLYCSSCHQNGNAFFYTLEKRADDPATLFDCRQLLLALGKSTSGQQATHPCPTCPQRESCFGDTSTVLDTIAVLSFYPFFMLINECDSCEGFHFLPLFHGQHVNSSQQQNTNSDQDGAIHSILQTVVENWQYPPMESKQAIPVKTGHSMEETLCSGPSQTQQEEYDDDLSQETVILSASSVSTASKVKPDQDATIICASEVSSVAKQQQAATTPRQTLEPKKEAANEDIDLAETVILRPGEKL